MMHAFIPSLGTQINLNFRGRHEITFTCSGCPQIFRHYLCFSIWWRRNLQRIDNFDKLCNNNIH